MGSIRAGKPHGNKVVGVQQQTHVWCAQEEKGEGYGE